MGCNFDELSWSYGAFTSYQSPCHTLIVIITTTGRRSFYFFCHFFIPSKFFSHNSAYLTWHRIIIDTEYLEAR